jgi:hypothetical protein
LYYGFARLCSATLTKLWVSVVCSSCMQCRAGGTGEASHRNTLRKQELHVGCLPSRVAWTTQFARVAFSDLDNDLVPVCCSSCWQCRAGGTGGGKHGAS